MKISDRESLVALKTDLFSDFLKCTEITSSGNTMQSLFFYDVAAKLVAHYTKQYYDSFENCFEQGTEVIMSRSPAEAALSFTHWLIGIEARPEWIPEKFEKNKKDIESQIQKTVNMYRAFNSQSSDIILSGQ